jgi:hypothetical protein
MAVTMKNGVFCDVTSCGSCWNRRFWGTYVGGGKNRQTRTMQAVTINWRKLRRNTKLSMVAFLCTMLQLLVTANVVPSSLILFSLMMEATNFSETSVLTRVTSRHNPEDGILYYLSSCLERLSKTMKVTLNIFSPKSRVSRFGRTEYLVQARATVSEHSVGGINVIAERNLTTWHDPARYRSRGAANPWRVSTVTWQEFIVLQESWPNPETIHRIDRHVTTAEFPLLSTTGVYRFKKKQNLFRGI